MTCPFCHRLRGHQASCRLDGAKSYELVEVIHEMAGRLQEWVRVDEERDLTNEIHDATRKLLGMPPAERLCATCHHRDLATIEPSCLNVRSTNNRRFCEHVIGCDDWQKDKR